MEPELEEVVAILAEPAEYPHHLNEVVGLTTRDIVFLKRKFVSRSGHEIVRYPLDACARVKHVEERPVTTIVTGALLVAFVAFVLYMLVVTWDRLEPQTRVPIGALGLAGIYGVRRLIGARRHRLVFTMTDEKTLKWTSRPGEFDSRKASVGNVVTLARSREILDASRLVRS